MRTDRNANASAVRSYEQAMVDQLQEAEQMCMARAHATRDTLWEETAKAFAAIATYHINKMTAEDLSRLCEEDVDDPGQQRPVLRP